jgi:hypothetical protein
MLSIEMTWDGERTSAVGLDVRSRWGALRRVCTRGLELWEGLKVLVLQRHFWARNEPYALGGSHNPLKSQQMRPPSERTNCSRPCASAIVK